MILHNFMFCAIKDIFSKIDEFQKSRHPVANLLSTGVVSYEGDKWAKHRNIIAPAFGNQNLKVFFLFLKIIYIYTHTHSLFLANGKGFSVSF